MKAIVLGGGIVGLNISLALQDKGFEVTLVERERVRTAACYGNAGHIAVEQIEPLASMAMVKSAPRRLFSVGGALGLPLRSIGEWLPFSLKLLGAARPERFARGKAALSALVSGAMAAWERRVKDIGAADLLRRDGHYVVWESEDSAAKGLAAWQKTDTGEARFHVATSAELEDLRRIAPDAVHGAIRFENTGQIGDMSRLLETLEATFVARGGIMCFEQVLSLVGDRAVSAVLAKGRVLEAEAIIVSAGIWSKDLLTPLGLKIPMIAERGYHLQTADHAWPQGLPPVVFEDRSMIVTGFEGGLRAASFVELGRAGDPPDRRKWVRLRQHIKALKLPFRKAEAATEWFGTRPTLPDYLPAIGRVADKPNLYYAFGHQHLGLTLGPITGEIVADMVMGGETPPAFSLARFQ